MRQAQKLRVLVLLTVLAVAAIQYARVRFAESWISDWAEPERVGIVLLLPPGIDERDSELLEPLWQAGQVGDNIGSVEALEDWFRVEHNRYRSPRGRAPIELVIEPPNTLSSTPPPPPRGDLSKSFFDRYRESRAFLSYYARLAPGGPRTTSSLVFVVFYRPSESAVYDKVHSVADRRSRRGFVFARLDSLGVEGALVNIAHELLHLFGATDKYEGQRCVFPEGYAAPFKEPRYPQHYAEVMAQGIPFERGRSEQSLQLFEDMRVGVETAYEIGWIEGARRDRYYRGDPEAGPRDD